MRAIGTIITICAFTLQFRAQAPASNIYVFDMARKGDSSFLFARPRFMTYFNASGYNNHPFFISSDEFLFASRQPNESQPDILRINLRDSSMTYLTKTAEGEYSPKIAPFENARDAYYAIRMEFTGKDTLLRLWKMPTDPTQVQYASRVFPVFKDLINVGYYEFGPGGQVALHLNGSPSGTNALALGQLNMGANSLPVTVASNIGRCFRFIPYPAQLVFLQKNTDVEDMLMSLELGYSAPPNNSNNNNTRQAKPLIAPLPGSQDFAVLSDGTLLMASGSRLFKFKPLRDKEWVPVADFSAYQLNQITRLEVNRDNNRIILVN